MNIILRSRTREHVITFWKKTQDEEIKKLFPLSNHSLDDALRQYDESQKASAISYGAVIYHDDQYVGDIWCYDIDERDDKMGMLSIVIFEKEDWNKGIATKATKLFIKDIFDKFNIEKLGAFTYSFNDGSIRLLEKVGFVKIEAFVEDEIESYYFELHI